ncbi:MAG TPA: polysaccharide deacetylase family protein [Cytophagaceae bacterium]|jgi:peptidoglycan/xylan/chitin deacetylase (PgdA/CDA1 family)
MKRWFRLEWILSFFYPSLLWFKKEKEKTIYLTFDDGPVPDVTPFVLDELNRHKVKATFFCVGDNVRKFPLLFDRILEEGHTIGNHTFNHLNGWHTNSSEYFDNINKAEEIFKSSTTHDKKEDYLRLFRPPYGKISRSQITRLKSKYTIAMWDVLTKDYDPKFPPDKCLHRSIKLTHPGSIVIFHDSIKAEKNLRAVLPSYLSHFCALGYSFRKL